MTLSLQVGVAYEATGQWKLSAALMHLDVCLRVGEEAVVHKVCRYVLSYVNAYKSYHSSPAKTGHGLLSGNCRFAHKHDSSAQPLSGRSNRR